MIPHPCIKVRRGDVASEIIKQHQCNKEFWKCRPYYQYLGEPGLDVGGVTRNVIADFYSTPVDIFKNIVLKSFVPIPCPTGCLCDLCSKIFVQNFVNGGQVLKTLPKLTTLALFCSPNEITPGIRHQCVQLFQEELCCDTQKKLADSCRIGLSADNAKEMEAFLSNVR